MPITRSFTNAFSVVDYTSELQLIPLLQTPITSSGIFQEEYLSNHTVNFEETLSTYGIVGDSIRGSKPQVNTDNVRSLRSYSLPHFGLIDTIVPEDIQGKSAYGVMTQAETEANIMARKMEKIVKTFSHTLETARLQTLTTGSVYAPNGTITGSFFTNTGVTQTVVNFALDTAGTNVMQKIEDVVSAVQDNAMSGDVITNIICYTSRTFFDKLINHAKVQAAYNFYAATAGQSINRNRAGDSLGYYREFQYGNIRFIDLRNKVPDGEAVFVPLGTDAFTTFYGPASKMGIANTVAQRLYLFQYADPKGSNIELEASSDFLNVLKRPQVVIKGLAA